MFAGNKVPFLADVVNKSSGGLSRAIRVAIGAQYLRDSLVKFKQIELEKSLTKLFVDLDVDLRFLDGEEAQALAVENLNRKAGFIPETFEINRYYYSYGYLHHVPLVSALGVLLSESSTSIRKILLEGGPGQGKSTITQMITQIYRSEVLLRDDLNPEERWFPPQKKRLPFRMELRHFAEWLGEHREASVEEYLASLFQKDSGGSQVIVDDIHSMVEHSPVLLIFDGLDEVGSSDLRDQVLVKIVECVDRFETTLHSDLKVVVTTRPPAIAGRREQLASFRRFPIAPMEKLVINSYLDRWLSVQVHDQSDRRDVHTSFERRRNETHVAALAKNPMQLSVLLHFIRLKGEAFPDRRAELYRDYFRTVIDRDVEKSSELRQKRELIETLHQLLGYKIHSLTEAEKADGTLRRAQLLEIVHDWMMLQVSNPTSAADEIFRLGEERLGLIVALKGEGEEATYGYEIQPIREYFAAAYINEQIQGDAHEVFQSLIGRPYWKEVALFLAGLRRPNEKADLLTRANAVEREPEVPWRHDGRTIILQLLQEGVFSQPGHVFSEAVDFMIDLLDPSLVTIPNEPKELLEALPNLIEQGERA
jgi:predicted NACHT family NTPase